MGSVAASGGYWVSTPADFIYAEPSTITGSIGVFGVIPSFQGTLQKLGIGADGVKTTPLSGEPDLFKGPSPEANQLIQNGVNSMYGRFLGIVAASRHKTPQQVDQIAQGRVWDGGTAHQIGLVDGFGGMRRSDRQGGGSWPSSATSGASAISSRRSAASEQLLETLAEPGQRRRRARPTTPLRRSPRQPQLQLAAMLARGALDPDRPEHPGPLPGMRRSRARSRSSARTWACWRRSRRG